ncbi:Uncharacterised protein [Vibrio cholerae]|nr:Uncharacterised protein [Vibrio cholerae]CSI60005.1 Uncharacterised protein [Vibrio cholerae]
MEHLRNKFHFTNAARTELDVVTQTTAAHFAADHGFHSA